MCEFFKTITGAMSTLNPPVSLGHKDDQFRIDYIQDQASSQEFDYPPVSMSLHVIVKCPGICHVNLGLHVYMFYFFYQMHYNSFPIIEFQWCFSYVYLFKSINETAQHKFKGTLIQWNIYNIQNFLPLLRSSTVVQHQLKLTNERH